MKKLNLLIALFFIATLSFNVYLNLNNPFQFSSEQVIAQETGREKTTSCPDHNYIPNRYLTTKDITVKGTEVKGTASAGGIIDKIIDITIGFFYDGEDKYIKTILTCDGWAKGACCDQRRIGELVGTKTIR